MQQPDPPTPTVGLVGVGIIGRAIAEVLGREHVPLVVHDVRPEATAGLAPGVVASTVEELARTSSVVLVAVRDDAQCEEVVTAIARHATPGSVIVIHATVQPSTVVALDALATAHGLELLDAPLAGTGEEGIHDGSMWALVGGPEERMARVDALLARYTSRRVHTGAIGSGSALKLAHNVFVYLGYQAVFEAVALARAAGVAEGLLAEVTTASQMLSPALRVYHDIAARRRVDPGGPDEQAAFATYAAILDKDLDAALALARAHGLALPAAALLAGSGRQIYHVASPTELPIDPGC
jgi:3-hydroxyisobutyrate dehydrogenase-like beta-hydroxyacid dehydrogenase